MLAPHNRENAELGIVRLAAENLKHMLIFLRRDTVFLDDFRGNVRLGHQYVRRA